MSRAVVSGGRRLRGEFVPPPDKSISHRAVMFSSLAKGGSRVKNFLRAGDVLSTISAFRALGITVDDRGDELLIEGRGMRGLREPDNIIDCGNSGTTLRLLSGILSGNPFFSVLSGDDSLRKRPMQRVIQPLREMGASLSARDNDRYPPLAIRGGTLKGVRYCLPVASAQLKSAVLLAGLYAEGETEVIEPVPSRDHTERMLPSFGAALTVAGPSVRIQGGAELSGCDTTVPGDFSSAAFFLVGALLLRGSDLRILSVGVNPSRTGLVSVLERMGARIVLDNVRHVSGEPVADISCREGGGLQATETGPREMPLLIDEFPILAVAATQADGVTVIRGAEELRVKESDRIMAMATELKKFGAEIEEYPDGVAIRGRTALRGCSAESYGDHRIAMSLAVAGLLAEGTTTISDASCVDISFPGFFGLLERLSAGTA